MNQTSIDPSPSTTHAADTARRSPRIAVVCSSWHREIVHRARDALLQELHRHGVAADDVDCFEVPGAFEIPLLAQRLARARRHDAIVACGLVVDGGIYRHDFVAHAVIDALMRVQLDSDVPVFSAVLTPQAFHEHGDHLNFFAAHFDKKGVEVAQACMAQLAALRALSMART
ncbi:MAG: 6,7-dimethyl-8-ribityllumazine synthase [Rubrivivax sp.]|nr:6,7-dimethyl-8-ribityllumazine synthase [Rubrivivax sp.]MBK7262234.1 6,7-dimethyl-8-ribityllumazine synthase [Rubrivivax sp.]MBK8528448.1 6,7-dimethyl-8-ribityllumazine synthase [Rubrivivax sp.]